MAAIHSRSNQFLPLDGSKAMTGDLDMGDHYVNWTKARIGNGPISNSLVLYRIGAATYAHLYGSSFYAGAIQSSGSSLLLSTGSSTAYPIIFRTWNGAWQEVMRCINGYIRVPNMPVADPGLGNNELWEDAGAAHEVKVGT